ncbi:MAG: DUF721 domain-containing protein [Pseudomonadota bacterium]|nr:DUF721 domain-containing protein [Pseudomonadota bacterium]
MYSKRSRNHSFLSIDEIANKLIKPKIGKNKLINRELTKFWPEIVGKEISNQSTPEKIVVNKRNKEGTLYLRVNSGASAILIQPSTNIILDKVNTFLGKKEVKYLKVILGEKN